VGKRKKDDDNDKPPKYEELDDDAAYEKELARLKEKISRQEYPELDQLVAHHRRAVWAVLKDQAKETVCKVTDD